MQLKIKKGIELLDTYENSKISVYNDSICVNFKQRYTYSHLTQKGKTITIYAKDDPTEDNSTLSMIKLVFTGEADKFIFDYFEKDQLSLKRLKFYSFHSENGHKQENVAHFVLRLGEGCLTDAQFSHKFQWQLLPNRCYLLGGLSVGT